MKRFTPYFSDASRARAEAQRLAKRNAALETELAHARQENERLRQKQSELINRINSEAFRLKAQTGCYSRCPVFRPKERP
jgi:hypothetical protein